MHRARARCFVREESALALEPAIVAGERSVGADHAVAGDDEADRVGTVAEADRSAGRKVARARTKDR